MSPGRQEGNIPKKNFDYDYDNERYDEGWQTFVFWVPSALLLSNGLEAEKADGV